MTTTPDPAGDPAPRGQATRPLVVLVVVLLVGVLVGGALVVGYRAGRPETTGSAGGSGDASTPATPGAETTAAPTCRPGPDRPAPVIDLGVQPATAGGELRSRDEVDRLVGLAQGAGASIISTSVSWRFLQPQPSTPPDRWRFEGLDRVLSSAADAGLQVRLQLIGMPRWAMDRPADWTRTTPPTTPTELGRWTTFVSTVARRVEGRVAYLEVWNEPNREAYWPGGPDVAGFARLLAATYSPVKAVAPDIQVVSGGLVDNDIGYLDVLYQTFDDLDISPRPFDLVGVHPFSGAEAPDAVDPARRYERAPFGSVDQNFTGFAALHDVMEQRGDGGTDLYISAFGYGTRANRGEPSVPDALRAEYVVEALEIVTCTPYVRAFSWYYLHPTPFDPVAWTLLDRRLRPTLTYDALAAWARAAATSGAPAP